MLASVVFRGWSSAVFVSVLRGVVRLAARPPDSTKRGRYLSPIVEIIDELDTRPAPFIDRAAYHGIRCNGNASAANRRQELVVLRTRIARIGIPQRCFGMIPGA